MKTFDRRHAVIGLGAFAISVAAGRVAAEPQQRPRQGSPRGQQQPPRAPAMQQERGRSELMKQDRNNRANRDVYGGDLMTTEEQERYRERLERAESDAEWARIREEHQKEIQARAKRQGVELDPPVYGQHMMTAEERQRYERRLRDAASDGERERIQSEHRKFIQSRARELGIDVPRED